MRERGPAAAAALRYSRPTLEPASFRRPIRTEQSEVDQLIREELRMLNRKPTLPDFRERGQRVEKVAVSRASREVWAGPIQSCDTDDTARVRAPPALLTPTPCAPLN